MKSYLNRIFLAGIISLGFVACKSGDQEFPDFEKQRVYFSKQYPVRTVELGNDDYVDLTNDNDHKIVIKATMGGAYDNPRDITVNITADNSLCNGLKFKDTGDDVTPMPSNYYTLAANSITIPKGEISAGVEVQLTDDFFADELSCSRHYVIPIKMSNVSGADEIIADKDFVLYAVNYVNRYHGVYVRQASKTDEDDVEEEFKVTTQDLNTGLMEYPFKDAKGQAHNCVLKLNFADGTITTDDPEFVVSGTVSFVEKDENYTYGHKHPDTIHLVFSGKNLNAEINETRIMAINLKYRGVKPETFEVTE